MSIENEIADLTQSTTDLLNAVNTKKATLDTAVSNAETAVTDATSQVSLAAAEKVGAQTARDTAETFKDQAYTYSQSAASAVAYQDLTAIAQTKAVSAVDVFVYDTSKDSDGGAWRQRTQGTSWYNETLNTSTRGSRKEFPAVAVIVAEVDKVTIYDGDDPSLPMWMVFNRLHAIKDMLGRRDSVSVQSINGLLCVVASDAIVSGGYAPLIKINFISDVVKHTNNVGTYTFKETISEREAAVYSSDSAGDTDYWIVSEGSLVSATLNDIAMTVLPDAPIDPATGLPIPTIAVATAGGVSVIKDDGTVVDITATDGENLIELVEFLDTNKISFYNTYHRSQSVFNIPSSDVSVIGSIHRGSEYRYSGHNSLSGIRTIPTAAGVNSIGSGVASKGSDLTLSGVKGLSLINRNETTPANGMVNYITSKYNTGWMNGDIKLATLSDTDDTDLVGSELVDVNNTSGQNASVSISGTQVTLTNNGTYHTMGWIPVSLVAGDTYTLSIDYVSKSTTNDFQVRLFDNAKATGLVSAYQGDTAGTYSFTYTATATNTHYIRIAHLTASNGATVVYDNVSVRLAEEDRSVNNNGLQVFGTMQKNPVATGADLVAYSGFSSTNYLMQPYNSDLDFGTGDFCVMGWVKNAFVGRIFSRDDTSNNSRIVVDIGGGYYRGFVANSLGTTTLLTSTSTPSGNWDFVCFMRRSGYMYIYINGTSNTPPLANVDDVNNTGAKAYLGVSGNVGSPSNGSLALVRISATAPTAEQIAKIYRDEKVLFQEGAQATLYGTSDAVTALAYDDSTELLHVGTSAGRSVFSGLQRVDNTTDAVGVAISASDNFIVEE